jgi:hypothetical protein
MLIIAESGGVSGIRCQGSALTYELSGRQESVRIGCFQAPKCGDLFCEKTIKNKSGFKGYSGIEMWLMKIEGRFSQM